MNCDNIHIVDYEVNDVETTSCYNTNQHSGEVYFVDNSLFKMDATLSYDNLLFEVDFDHPSNKWNWAQFTPFVDTV